MMNNVCMRVYFFIEDKDIEEYICDNYKFGLIEKKEIIEYLEKLKKFDVNLRFVGYDFNIRYGFDMGGYGVVVLYGSI